MARKWGDGFDEEKWPITERFWTGMKITGAAIVVLLAGSGILYALGVI